MPIMRRTLVTLLGLVTWAGVLGADPPGRAARISYFNGSVSFRPASVDEWAEATTTYPLTIGDQLWADADARGEIRVGRGSVVRLGPSTSFSFLNLDDDTTQMRISEGTLAVTVRRLDPREVVEVDTPNAAVSLLRPGFYRVSVDQDGYETAVTVRDGEIEVMAGGATVPVYEGETILVSGDDSSPRYDIREARASDGWENWCLERDRREARFESRRYVSDAMIGYEDLDEYGRWRNDPEYGHVWVPINVAANWAPYRYGRWAWVPPWGWTWVDEAPWGFAPFHYGRWARRDWGWCWVPGTIVARPVYAPALVAFIGTGDLSVSLSLGRGGIAWFPLGPREVYVPPYRVSPNYIRELNVANVSNIRQINVTNINVTNVTYVNRQVEGAITAVNNETFVRGRAVHRAAVVVPRTDMHRAQVQSGVVELLKPQGTSVIGEAGPRAVRKPSERAQDRQVVTRMKPPKHVPHAIPDAPPAHEPAVLVKPVEAGKPANLKPAREGLPKPREVVPGERPQPAGPGEGRRGRGRRQEIPGKPGATTPPATGEQERERARETEKPREPGRRATPEPAVTPEPDAERERGRGRQKDIERERPGEKPPETTPSQPEERRRPRDRATPPAPEVTPTPDSERERGRGRQKDIERERPGEKPPEVSPAPDTERERGRGRQKDIERERPGEKPPEATPPQPEGRQGGKEKKPKGKPTPSPTPTPSPEGNSPSP